jgi:F420-dependent oxidoreductase-like protein
MSKVSFGVFAPQGWKTELIGIEGAEAKWAKCREIALLAEELGFESIWVYDHFHNVPTPAHEAVFECWTTMAALAEATSTIRLGQMVSCTSYRNPALVAKITSSIDVISGGRLDWGVGAGWYDQEYRAHGYEFPAPKVRIAMLREGVEIVKAMWSEPNAHYEGKYFTVAGAECDPKPVQQPHPPIWIGGGGEQLTLRVVARLADRSNFGGKPQEWGHKRDVLLGHCADVGRDPDEIAKTWSPEVLLRETEAEARAFHESRRQAQPWLEDWDGYALGNLAGPPEQVCERVRTYAEMGCSYIVPWNVDYPDDTTLRLLATEVMPEFR